MKWNLLLLTYRVTYVPFIHSFPHHTSPHIIIYPDTFIFLSCSLSRSALGVYKTHFILLCDMSRVEKRKNIFSHINKWIVVEKRERKCESVRDEGKDFFVKEQNERIKMPRLSWKDDLFTGWKEFLLCFLYVLSPLNSSHWGEEE